MPASFHECLDDLQRRLDDAQEEQNRRAWRDFCEDRCREDVFVPPARPPATPGVEWPDIHINDAQHDYEAMMWSQFKELSNLLAQGSPMCLGVRANYGTGILPSLFGCENFIMPRETHTLPTAKPLGTDQIPRLVAKGVPNIRGGLGGPVFECGKRFLEVFARYPKLARHIALYHPDAQGPIDVAEVVWGSEIFLAFYDDTTLLRSFLDLITETYAAFLREWYRLVLPTGASAVHWALMHPGRLMIRNDSLMNLSPEIYAEFVRPLDERLFAEFGGGAIHFCGRGDHFIAAMSETRGLTAINMSQPEHNNMETIYRHTVDRGLKVINLNWKAVQAAGRPLRGQVEATP